MRGRRELLQESPPFRVSVAGREEFLELVDGDHDPLARPELRDRTLQVSVECTAELVGGTHSRTYQYLTPAPASGQRPPAQRRQDAGSKEVRLPDSGRAEDANQRPFGKARDQF